jgi:very-short-patch-repair endonuclease
MTIHQKIEIWKNKLLDLGKRNRLLNYKDTKRSNLRMLEPNMRDLWKWFVVNEKTIEFPYIDDSQLLIQQEEAAHTVFSFIKTNQTLLEQQKTLHNLRDKTKIAKEEQGINILYLSFGFLRWSERADSQQYFDAPIVLVPVELKVESIISPYILSLHEDEIIVNPTLAYKLKTDYGINLPEFDPDDGLEHYLNIIQDMVSATDHLRVDIGITLSLLSFLKINMYDDLTKNEDRVKNHSIIRALAGDASALSQGANFSQLHNYDHDTQLAPIDMFQVIDADSSQQDAILLSKKGDSFVLQGPPGTGKSQTITNIIAENLAAGKKILFVSEKVAALDVVHKRLLTANLADFCLVLHSHHTNKKEILAQLAAMLDKSTKKALLQDSVYQKLDRLKSLKERLNMYAQQLFAVVPPLQKTIYDVYGNLAMFSNYKNVIFDIPAIESITPNILHNHLQLLTQLALTMDNSEVTSKYNPWNGVSIAFVTNEIRSNIHTKLPQLLTKLKSLVKTLGDINSQLQLHHPPTYAGLIEVHEVLQLASHAHLIPLNLIYKENIVDLQHAVVVYKQQSLQFYQLRTELGVVLSALKKYNPIVETDNLSYVVQNVQINEIRTNIANFQLKYPSLANWNHEPTNNIQELFNQLFIHFEKIADCKKHIFAEYEKELFDIDYKSMLQRFKTEYRSFLKYFKSQYRKDVKLIQGSKKHFVQKPSDQEIVTALLKLREIDESQAWIKQNTPKLTLYFGAYFDENNPDLAAMKNFFDIYNLLTQAHETLNQLSKIAQGFADFENSRKLQFGDLYNGIPTDWDALSQALIWALSFKEMRTKYQLNNNFVELVCRNQHIKSLCTTYDTQLVQLLGDTHQEMYWFANLFTDSTAMLHISLNDLIARVETAHSNLHLLELWITHRDAKNACLRAGLGDYIQKIEIHNIQHDHVTPIFEKRFYQLWLDTFLPHYPAVQYFQRKAQENAIQEFVQLDQLQLTIASQRIQKKLIDGLPSLDLITTGNDELSILKREINRQRRIMPLRKLFTAIPNLLLKLKPCLMMSPLSVSMFLVSDNYEFDMVIFDEASQINTENALGAILRGKQVIIAGDNKQLPPTNFFNSTSSDNDFDSNDDDDDGQDVFESVLDESRLFPACTLRWHYRSRHEHLIAFSNAKFYRNNLITFPANVERIPDNGVEYEYVPTGVYDRGGKTGNANEAARVAELVFSHFEKHPNRSLGVIAFGEAQQQAIDTVIRRIRKQQQQFEPFFDESREEAFFVKNLENVQGDERDTIIFSIGYARDPQGKFLMNFGPLNRSGGERRLNVAITRAKYNLKLVGSILPDEIDVDRVSSDGPKLLRAYIDYAMHGPGTIMREIIEPSTIQHDSPFESAVYTFLESKGYKIRTQVGCSGYRIDMAIKHPTISGRYVIGIECDGATYHSTRTARERDRLRQSVLEDMGWTIYRVWSTDWIKHPDVEGQKLVNAIDAAINGYTVNRPESSPSNSVVHEYVQLAEKERDAINPYGLGHYTQTLLQPNGSNVKGMDEYISEIIQNEYPVHADILFERVNAAFGSSYSKQDMRKKLHKTLAFVDDSIKKGEFYYPRGYTSVIPRAINNTRTIEHISLDEIAAAMLIIITKTYGITKEELFKVTRDAYGYQRSGNRIQEAFNQSFDLVMGSGQVKEIEGKLRKI